MGPIADSRKENLIIERIGNKLERHGAIVRIGIVSVSVSLTLGVVLASLLDLRLIWRHKRKLKKNRRKVMDLDGFQGVVKKKKGKNIISRF